MRVVILCGGLGTRLREETEFRPKPMVEVGGRPILWHVMKMFAHHGLTDFVCCLGYKGNQIKEYFLNYEAMNSDFTVALGDRKPISYHTTHQEQNFKVSLVDTGQDSMTGGRVKRIERHIPDELFMVTYGDGLANIDIGALIAFHKKHGKIATVSAVKPTSRFGILDLAGDGAVTSFAEKPQLEGWASAGFFVFDRRIFSYLDGDDCILEREPLERLCREGQLAAYRHTGVFYAMDTYRESKALNELWATGKAPWKVWQ